MRLPSWSSKWYQNTVGRSDETVVSQYSNRPSGEVPTGVIGWTDCFLFKSSHRISFTDSTSPALVCIRRRTGSPAGTAPKGCRKSGSRVSCFSSFQWILSSNPSAVAVGLSPIAGSSVTSSAIVVATDMTDLMRMDIEISPLYGETDCTNGNKNKPDSSDIILKDQIYFTPKPQLLARGWIGSPPMNRLFMRRAFFGFPVNKK